MQIYNSFKIVYKDVKDFMQIYFCSCDIPNRYNGIGIVLNMTTKITVRRNNCHLRKNLVSRKRKTLTNSFGGSQVVIQ